MNHRINEVMQLGEPKAAERLTAFSTIEVVRDLPPNGLLPALHHPTDMALVLSKNTLRSFVLSFAGSVAAVEEAFVMLDTLLCSTYGCSSPSLYCPDSYSWLFPLSAGCAVFMSTSFELFNSSSELSATFLRNNLAFRGKRKEEVAVAGDGDSKSVRNLLGVSGGNREDCKLVWSKVEIDPGYVLGVATGDGPDTGAVDTARK